MTAAGGVGPSAEQCAQAVEKDNANGRIHGSQYTERFQRDEELRNQASHLYSTVDTSQI